MSKYYKTRYQQDPKRKLVWTAIAEYLERYTGGVNSVLDLGCGYGDFVNSFEAKELIAIDLNAEVEKYLNPNVRFICTSATDLSMIQSGSLDLIFSSNLLEHLNDDQLNEASKEFLRVLKPGGKFITMQPNYYYAYREYFDDYTHKKVFSHESLSDFFRGHGFTVESLEKRFLPFSLKSKLPKSYWITKIYLRSFYRPFAKQMLAVFRK